MQAVNLNLDTCNLREVIGVLKVIRFLNTHEKLDAISDKPHSDETETSTVQLLFIRHLSDIVNPPPPRPHPLLPSVTVSHHFNYNPQISIKITQCACMNLEWGA